MEQYIPKSALVAEIESKIDKYTKRGEESDARCDGYGMYWGGVLSCLNEIRTLCDTIEVKEVDLNKEIDIAMPSKYCWSGDGEAVYSKEQMRNFAKHFFELGIKAQKGEEV